MTFFLILFGMVSIYLVLVELAKTRFYRLPRAQSPPPPSTHAQRLERRIHRRASGFIGYPIPGSETAVRHEALPSPT
jgi:hypothetical protein